MAIDRKRLLKPIRKLRKLVKKLGNQPAPEEVHDLRTSTNRFEALCEALGRDGHGVGKSAIKDLRRCSKRAGKVRDMDVLTDYASTIHLAGEEECTVRLLEHLGARRQKYARKLYAEVRPRRSRLRRDLRRIANSLAALIKKKGRTPIGNTAGPHATGTAVTLAIQLAVPHRLNRGNLHPYRLKVKKLRNVLKTTSSDTPFVDDLAKANDAIGEWHDWEELVSIAQKELGDGNPCRLMTELKRISRSRYDHALAAAHALRTNYLRSSDPEKKPAIPRLAVWDAIARLAG